MQTALKLVDESDDGLYLPIKANTQYFKIETEDSCYDIFEVCKTGGLMVSGGYAGPFVHCLLVGWGVVAEGCADLPTFEEHCKKPCLALVA